MIFLNPLDCEGNYSVTSNNTKLIHWPLMGGLLLHKVVVVLTTTTFSQFSLVMTGEVGFAIGLLGKNSGDYYSGIFAGQIPYLELSQQSQSTEQNKFNISSVSQKKNRTATTVQLI